MRRLAYTREPNKVPNNPPRRWAIGALCFAQFSVTYLVEAVVQLNDIRARTSQHNVDLFQQVSGIVRRYDFYSYFSPIAPPLRSVHRSIRPANSGSSKQRESVATLLGKITDIYDCVRTCCCTFHRPGLPPVLRTTLRRRATLLYCSIEKTTGGRTPCTDYRSSTRNMHDTNTAGMLACCAETTILPTTVL